MNSSQAMIKESQLKILRTQFMAENSPFLDSAGNSEFSGSSAGVSSFFFPKLIPPPQDLYQYHAQSFHEEQLFDKRRKTQSHSPNSRRILYKLYQVQNSEEITSPWSSSQNSNLDSSTQQIQVERVEMPNIRQKSTGSISLEIIENFHKFQQHLIFQKYLSDAELLEIKHNFIEPEKFKSSQVNYFTIILGNVIQLLDSFIGMTRDQLLGLQKCKEIIIRFDKLRGDMMNKLKSTEKSQTFSSLNIQFLNIIFGSIRYILTRFGRIINFYDTLQSYYKRKLFTMMSNKQAPAIRKIQQQESMLFSDNDQSKRSPASTNSSNFQSNSLNNSDINNLKGSSQSLSQIMQSPNLLSTSMTTYDQLTPGANNKAGQETAKEVFFDLTEKEKSICIEKYMKVITQRWRQEHEDERKMTVPLIVCRICSQKFYADMEKDHSKYCKEKVKKINEQPQLNQKFLELSNKLTECMLHIEKTNMFNTPRLTYSNKNMIHSTPTLARRNLGLSSLYSQDSGNNSDIELNSKSKEDQFKIDESQRKSSFYREERKQIVPMHRPIEEELKCDGASSSSSDGGLHVVETFNVPQRREGPKVAIPSLDLSKAQTASQHDKPMDPLTKLSLSKMESATQPAKPQNPLLMYTGRSTQAANEPTSQGNTQRTLGQIGQQLPSQVKNVSSTLNTLRVLEASKNIMSFEKPKTVQTQLSNVSVGEQQAKDIKNELLKSEDKPQEPEQSKEELSARPTFKQEESKIQQIAPSNSFIKSLFPIGNLPQVKPIPSKVEPSKNILGTFATIRQDLKKETQPPPLSARPAATSAMGFFNQQKTEEKKKFEENEAKLKQEEESKVIKIDLSKVALPTPKITSIQLPKSPYLQNVSRKFDNAKPLSQYFQNLTVQNDHVETPKSQMDLTGKSGAHMPTSPYISISKNMTKEQRKQQIDKLKKHVQIQLHKGTINDKQGKNRDKIPISNAFSLNIKNEREEAIKNMEHLRLSVKLKKRANPLEKLVNKLMHHENQEANQSLITTNILDVANISIAPPSPMNFSTISEELKSLPKPQTSLQKSHILGSKLQSITEDQEDDPGQSQKIISPTKHQLAESPLKLDQVDKKLDDLGQINKKKTFTGMSPIITFRPLNKIGSDSLQNTPLGTPDLRGAITSRDQYSQSQNSSQNFDDQKTNQVLVGLKSAKKEMDILENLKSMAVDIFNLSIQQINRKHQIKIMEQYLHQLKSIQYQGLLGYKSSIIVGQFISMIEDKIKAITEIEIIDKKYVKTLPGTELNIRLEEEKMNNSKLSRKMNLSIQSREAPSSIKKSSAKKSSSFFFPPTFSPRRENMLQAYAYMQQQQHSDNNSSQSDSMKGQPLQTNYSPQSFTNQKIDTLHFGSLEMQLTCATPLIAPRGLNFMNDGNQFINPHMLKLPPSYMSISQMHSPPVVNKTQYNNSNIVNSDKKNLQSIQEERTLEIKAQVNAAQVRLQLNNTQAQRQKSQFSNPSRLNQDKRSGSINSRISKSSFNESNGSCSSDSDIIIDLKESITLDQGAKTCKSPYVLTPKATENVTDSPGSIRSKQSKTSLSTFSKVKKAAESAQKQKSQERSPKDKISDEFFNDDDNITVRRSRHQSFDLSVKRKMSDTSQSKSRLLKKYHQDTFLRKGSNDFIECQSDIVIGTNYDQEGGENEDEDRKTNSDIHDMFQVHEIFEDEVKFNRLLARLQIQECLQQERDHAYKVNSESQHLDLEEEDSDEEVLTMERVRFSSCVNLPSQLESCSLESSEKQSQQQQQQVVVELIFFRISIHDFILLKTLNKGAYGKVILARKKNTDDFFAIKVLDKQKMVEKNVIEFIMNEKNILSQVSNDFIVRGVYTFQSKKYLYMVMEFMKGGDFASLLEEVEAFDEETARYYIAQIVLALDYLHKHGVIHRDLKPDNILIDSDGHIKLTDFGLSDAGVLKLKETAKKHSNKEGFQSPQTQMRELEMQQDIQKLLGAEASVLKQATLLLDEKKKTAEYPNIEPIKEDGKQVSGGNAHKNSGGNAKKPRMLGTAQYMAPEIIKGEEHTYALDFWSLGVIVYEFLTGLLPFNDETPDKIFEKIKIKQMTYPPVGRDEGQMTPEAHNFIDRLLTLDPKQRLGSNGIDEVKNHPYFREIQWDKIMEMEPPFKPVGREQDTKYFTKAAYQEDDIMPIINDQKSFQAHEVKEFNKFDVINYDALQSYNQKEAVKALERAKRMRKRAPPQKPKKSLLNETILMDIKVGITSVEQLAEKADEESLVTPKTSCQELHKLV